MSVITTYPFDNTNNYTKVNTEVSSGAGRLALVLKPSQIFNQDFAAPAGFTFDAAKTEFVAGVMGQKSQAPSGALAWATFTTDINLSAGGGDLTGTGFGGAVVIGNKLSLKGGTNKYVEYGAVGNFDSQQEGAIKKIYRPNYSGTPASLQVIFAILREDNNRKNRISLTHRTGSGDLVLEIRDKDENVLMSHIAIAAWNPTAGVKYEIEVDFNLNDLGGGLGATRVFLNGIVQGGVNTTIGLRDSNIGILRIGAGFTGADLPDFEMEDFIYFPTVQHTSSYTPGYTLPEAKYIEDAIDLPNFSYSLLGVIKSLEAMSVTETGNVNYTVEGMYWTGTAWAASNGTRTQSNPLATITANLATLDVDGQTVISVQVFWEAGNVKNSVDDLTLTYTGQQFAAEGTVLTNINFVANEIVLFEATEVKPANTDIGYIFEINGQNRWHDGTSFVNSDGTFAESLSLAEVIALLPFLPVGFNASIKILVVLVTANQDVSTPEIDNITVTYDFGALEPVAPIQSQVYGFLKDSENQPIVGATVTAVPNRPDEEYKEAASRVIAKTISKVTDSEGFFSMNLIISDEFEVGGAQKMRYVLSIAVVGQALPIFKNGTLNENQILFEVPNQPTTNITDQIGAI